MVPDFIPGDVLLLEREIPGIPYETGIFVLCALDRGTRARQLGNTYGELNRLTFDGLSRLC